MWAIEAKPTRQKLTKFASTKQESRFTHMCAVYMLYMPFLAGKVRERTIDYVQYILCPHSITRSIIRSIIPSRNQKSWYIPALPDGHQALRYTPCALLYTACSAGHHLGCCASPALLSIHAVPLRSALRKMSTGRASGKMPTAPAASSPSSPLSRNSPKGGYQKSPELTDRISALIEVIVEERLLWLLVSCPSPSLLPIPQNKGGFVNGTKADCSVFYHYHKIGRT